MDSAYPAGHQDITLATDTSGPRPHAPGPRSRAGALRQITASLLSLVQPPPLQQGTQRSLYLKADSAAWRDRARGAIPGQGAPRGALDSRAFGSGGSGSAAADGGAAPGAGSSSSQRHVPRSGHGSASSLCVQEILGRAKMNTVFDVIEVGSDGRTVEPVGGRTATELGLHSRDLSIFASDSRLSPQRATIAARGDRLLFRTEAIKAVIERDKCTLIKAKRDRDLHDIIKPMTLVVRAQPEVPFELSVLEVLLHVTLLYFERRRAHIHWLVDRIVGDASGGGGGGGGGRSGGSEGPLGRGDPFGGIGESTVQQFVPVGKLLTAVLHDAKETCDAINRFLDDDREALGYLLLSLPPALPAQPGLQGQGQGQGAAGGGGGGSVHLSAADMATLGAGPLAAAPTECLIDSNHSLAAAAAAAAAQRSEAGSGPRSGGAAAPGGVDGVVGGGGGGAGGGEGGGYGGGGAAAARRGAGVGAILQRLCDLTPAQRHERLRNQALEDASRILETYLREMESIVGSLLESEDYLESTRETYRMQLDSARNHIILVNLWISVASISLMVATLPAALFGMNVRHGWEESAAAFGLISVLSCALGVGAYPAFMKFFTDRFLRQSREGAWNLRMLRTFLMQHSDDLEAIREALRSLPRSVSGAAAGAASGPGGVAMTREEFRSHMRSRLPRTVRLSDSQLDYLFSHIDLDKDGVLSEVEATLRSARELPCANGANGDGNGNGGGNGGGGGHGRNGSGAAASPAVAGVGSDGLYFEEAVLLGDEDERGPAARLETEQERMQEMEREQGHGHEIGRRRGGHGRAHAGSHAGPHDGNHGSHGTHGSVRKHG